ncbi:calponin homology domain-containing protein [Obelidium mucronatum]|nr:calponin homology domain-containing protein [Obelidium mucronatum]
MGGVSAFGGVGGFNPFANGASPTNVLLKSRSSVTNSSVGGLSETDLTEACGKFEEIRDWIAESLGDEMIKNSTSDSFCSELLKDGSVLCRLFSALYPAQAIKYKPGKFLFIHKENLSNYLKACSGLGVSALFEYEDLMDDKRHGYVYHQLLSLKKLKE